MVAEVEQLAELYSYKVQIIDKQIESAKDGTETLIVYDPAQYFEEPYSKESKKPF